MKREDYFLQHNVLQIGHGNPTMRNGSPITFGFPDSRKFFFESAIPLRVSDYREIIKDSPIVNLKTNFTDAYELNITTNYTSQEHDDEHIAIVHHAPDLIRFDALYRLSFANNTKSAANSHSLHSTVSYNITEVDGVEKVVLVQKIIKGELIRSLSLQIIVELLIAVRAMSESGIVHGCINHETVFYDENTNKLTIRDLFYLPCGNEQLALYESGFRIEAHPCGKSDDELFTDYYACGVLILHLFAKNLRNISSSFLNKSDLIIATMRGESFSYLLSFFGLSQDEIPTDIFYLCSALLSRDIVRSSRSSSDFITRYFAKSAIEKEKSSSQTFKDDMNLASKIYDSHSNPGDSILSDAGTNLSLKEEYKAPRGFVVHKGSYVSIAELAYTILSSSEDDLHAMVNDIFQRAITFSPDESIGYEKYKQIVVGLIAVHDKMHNHLHNKFFSQSDLHRASYAFFISNMGHSDGELYENSGDSRYFNLPGSKYFFSIESLWRVMISAEHSVDNHLMGMIKWLIESGYLGEMINLLHREGLYYKLQNCLDKCQGVKMAIGYKFTSDVRNTFSHDFGGDVSSVRDMFRFYRMLLAPFSSYYGLSTGNRLCFNFAEAIEFLDHALEASGQDIKLLALPVDFYDFLLLRGNMSVENWPKLPCGEVFSEVAGHKHAILLGLIFAYEKKSENIKNDYLKCGNIVKAVMRDLSNDFASLLNSNRNREFFLQSVDKLINSQDPTVFALLSLLNRKKFLNDKWKYMKAVSRVNRISEMIKLYDLYIANGEMVDNYSKNFAILISCITLVISVFLAVMDL